MKPLTLMLVDDNPRFLSAASSYLGEIDEFILVSTLEGGKEAVAKAKELKPDVILVDLAMPDIAGLQLIPQLRESLPDLGIVALTVHDNPQYREAALEAGADAFVTKSQILKHLEPTIKEVRNARAPISEVESTPATALETQEGQAPVRALVVKTSRRILVMDDDPGLRNVYQKALRHQGYEVDLADTLDAARALFKEHVYGVFICDIHMGDERGTDLLAEIGGKLKEQGTEIIMASAYGQYRFMAEDYGSEYFLEKPVSIHTLVTLIERVLADSPTKQQQARTPAQTAAT